MKRLVIGVALASAALLTVVPAAIGTHSPGDGPDQDLASGTMESVIGTKFHVNAQSGPSGEDARGHFYVERKEAVAALDFAGDVTCLTVIGNVAFVGGSIDRSKTDLPFPGEGSGIILNIVDNGDLDTANGFFLATPPAVCPLAVAGNTMIRGNFIVHDATP